jgi:uncharacterized membrane protein
MNIVAAIGATCLGVVIGWLVRYFIRRFEKFGPAVLGAVVSVVLGGAVVKFLEADKSVWWFYPIGLLIGFVIYQIIVWLDSPSGGGKAPNWTIKSNPKYMGKRW